MLVMAAVEIGAAGAAAVIGKALRDRGRAERAWRASERRMTEVGL